MCLYYGFLLYINYYYRSCRLSPLAFNLEGLENALKLNPLLGWVDGGFVFRVCKIFMSLTLHPILAQSFAVIDQEIGPHQFSKAEYAIARRVIHATADFEFKNLLRFSPEAIDSAITALQHQVPIVTDVNMIKYGINRLIGTTFNNVIISAVDHAIIADPGKTRTETGLLKCCQEYPDAIFVIGNAPTALLTLCEQITEAKVKPALVIGVPVGFISVVESKGALAKTPVPQILTQGRKGGSAVAAAIINALTVLAWEQMEHC